MITKNSAFATVKTEGAWTPAVVKAFLKNEGEHCPHCGSERIRDALESDASGQGWGIQWTCDSCDEHWWNEYVLQSYEVWHSVGLKINVGKRAYKKEPVCPHCRAAADFFNYDSIVVSPLQVDQVVRCGKCSMVWTEVNKLQDVTCSEEA